MFNAVSMAGVGWAVVLLMTLLKAIGVEADEATVTGAVEALITFAGFVLAVWGQLRRSDLKYGLIRQ